MTTIIVALGPNSIEIPCLIFPNIEEAQSFLENTIGKPKISKHPLHETYHVDWRDDDKRWELFFTSQYYGCGGVWAFAIKEVQMKTPFLEFNLD